MAPNIVSAGGSLAADAVFAGAGLVDSPVAGGVFAGAGASGAWTDRFSSADRATSGGATSDSGGRTDVDRGIGERGLVGRGIVALWGVLGGAAGREAAENSVDGSVDGSDATVPVSEPSAALDGSAGAFGVVVALGGVARVVAVPAAVGLAVLG